MKLIRIINGTYGHRPEGSRYILPVKAGDPPIRVADDKAERLVENKIAEYVDEKAVATPQAPSAEDEQRDNMPDGAEGAEDDSGDELPDEESLKKMTKAQLEELAADLGIDLSALRTKADLVEAINAELNAMDDMPEPGVEDVVE